MNQTLERFKNPVEKILTHYNKKKVADKIQAENKHIAAIIHLCHKYDEVQAAAIIGSRVDDKRPVTDESDIDLYIKLRKQNIDDWAIITSKIKSNFQDVIKSSTESFLDISFYSHPANDPEFHHKAYEQAIMVKGSKKSLKK